jgi:hypothetical protein
VRQYFLVLLRARHPLGTDEVVGDFEALKLGQLSDVDEPASRIPRRTTSDYSLPRTGAGHAGLHELGFPTAKQETLCIGMQHDGGEVELDDLAYTDNSHPFRARPFPV